MSKINAFNLYLIQMPQVETRGLRIGVLLDYLLLLLRRPNLAHKNVMKVVVGIDEDCEILQNSLCGVERSANKDTIHKPLRQGC